MKNSVKYITSKNGCTSTFLVNGVALEVWAIMGGTIAIGFAEYDPSFIQRCNYCPRLDTSKDPHYQLWGGVKLSDIKGGKKPLIDFVKRNVLLKRLKTERYDEIKSILCPNNKQLTACYSSQEFCTASDVRFKLHFNVGHLHISATTISSISPASEYIEFVPECWKNIIAFMEQMRKQYPDNYIGLHCLSTAEYELYREMVYAIASN